MKKFQFILFIVLTLFLAESCKPQSNAQRASKIAKKRYRYIKHDCNCHAYIYHSEDLLQNEYVSL